MVKLERFNESSQISRIIGLAPGIRESGDSRQQGNILRSGNSRIQTALVEAAWRWVSANLGVAKVYHRLVQILVVPRKQSLRWHENLELCFIRTRDSKICIIAPNRCDVIEDIGKTGVIGTRNASENRKKANRKRSTPGRCCKNCKFLEAKT